MNKFKAFFKRAKAKLAGIAAAVVACAATALAACAEETGGVDMSTALSSAGEQLTTTFGDLVTTMVPVIIGILSSGLVIFGIMALIKLAKKTFGKVAG